jgi:hypothetical protein
MFSIKLRSFGFIAPKTWMTLADVLFTHVLGEIKPKDLSLIENIS